LQTLQETIAHNTLPLQNLLTQAVPSDIIAPSQPWQKGTLHLSLGFTFAPHATKPVLSVLPSTLAVAEPPKPDWTEYDFSDLTPASQGIASIPTLPLQSGESGGDGGTSEFRTEIPSELTPEIQPTFTGRAQAAQQSQADLAEPSFRQPPQTEEDTDAIFDEDWVSGVGAPSPEIAIEPIEESPAPQEIAPIIEDEDNDLFGEYFREPAAPPVGQSTVENFADSPLEEAEMDEGEDLFHNWGEAPADSSAGSLPQGLDDRPEDLGLDALEIDAIEIESPRTAVIPESVAEPDSQPDSQPDFEIVLDAALLKPSVQTGGYGQNGASLKVNFWDVDPSDQSVKAVKANNAEVVVDETENWNLEQWRIRWCSDHTDVESDRLQLPRSYHVKTLLHRLGTTGKVTQPSLNKENHLVEIIDLACEALKLPDPPPTLLNTKFVPSESSLATLVNRLTWELIRNSYGITCLLSGIPAQILQPEWGWESGVLRLLPILKVQSLNEPDQGMESAAIDLQVDLGTGAPAPLETILLLPDILVSIDGSDWQQTRESVIEFRSGILKQIYQLLPELEVLCCPVPVELAIDQDLWQPATVHLQLELGFQGN
jgi:hypothetical protein